MRAFAHRHAAARFAVPDIVHPDGYAAGDDHACSDLDCSAVPQPQPNFHSRSGDYFADSGFG